MSVCVLEAWIDGLEATQAVTRAELPGVRTWLLIDVKHCSPDSIGNHVAILPVPLLHYSKEPG
jgi:hypothetical protein